MWIREDVEIGFHLPGDTGQWQSILKNVTTSIPANIEVIAEMMGTGQTGTAAVLQNFVFIVKLLCDL
jgi:hypothetical protein